jgi:hypothetical protein
MLPPQTQSGKVVLESLTSLSKELKFYADGFKATRQLKSKYAEIDQIKRGVSAATQSTKQLEKQFKTVGKDVQEGKKLWDKLLSKIPGRNKEAKAAKAGGGLASIAVLAGLTVALAAKIITDIQIQNIGFDNEIRNEAEFQKAFNRYQRNVLDIRALNKKVEATNKTVERNNKDLDSISKQFYPLKLATQQAEKKANDSLYEVRQGRKILEGKISEARKLANDSLAETRGTATKIRAEIQQQQQSFKQQINRINSQLANFGKGVSDNFQQTINATVSKIRADLDTTRQQIANIKPQQIDVNSIIDKARLSAQGEINNLKTQLNALGSLIPGLQRQTQVALDLSSANSQNIAQLDKGVNAAMAEAKKKGIPDLSPLQSALDKKFNDFVAANNKALNIRDLQQSELSKDLDRRFADFIRQAGLTADQRFAEFQRANNEALRIRDLQTSNLSKEFDRRLADFERQSRLTNDQRFDEFTKQNDKDLRRIGADITTINTKIKEGEKVNDRVEKKIDSLIPKIDGIIPTIAGIPLIAGKAADLIKPNLLTAPDIEKATGVAMCRNLQTGCGKKAIDDAVGNVVNNNNNNTGAVLNALGAASDVANLALLPVINNKLGDQLPGGLSTVIKKITRNQAINQIANLVTMAAAIHNVVQLSDNAAVTFFGILDNIFAIPTLIINPEAETIDTRDVFGDAIENVMKSVFGVQEWAEIKQRWQTYNRIYQAGANSINELRNIGSSIVSAVEQTARLTGKGFNALQDEGILSELNWDYTPEDFKLRGGLYGKLGKVADGISIVTEGLEAIEAITSEIRSAVDSANQIKQESKEIEDSIKELIGQSKTKREEEVEALPAKSYSWEDLI